MAAPESPPTRESPPHTPRRSPRTRDRRWLRTPPTRSLHACDDDATLSIQATATFKLRMPIPSY